MIEDSEASAASVALPERMPFSFRMYASTALYSSVGNDPGAPPGIVLRMISKSDNAGRPFHFTRKSAFAMSLRLWHSTHVRRKTAAPFAACSSL